MIDEKKLIDRLERMNKYQEALDFLCNHAMEYVEDYDWEENECGEYRYMNKEKLNANKSVLQELIDRATPVKINEETATAKFIDGCPTTVMIYRCPKCGGRVHPFDGDLYCRHCGQALDWRDYQ